jgi:CheY-like chemotaxis protein
MPLSGYPELQSGVLLCIDDNEDALESQRAFLETFGYTVLTAPSGAKGLELASKCSVEVVIVDHGVPKMNRREVAIEMRRLRLVAPIILLGEAREVPERTLNLVDALISKDRLATHLLPTIAHLRGGDWTPPPSYDA